jgi:hypothetical protein
MNLKVEFSGSDLDNRSSNNAFQNNLRIDD